MKSQEKIKNKKGRKGCFLFVGILVAALIVYLYIRFFFVFGEGVKTGQLNYVVYKGYVFKTYEGKLIQSGLRSGAVNGSIQSNEFVFSVADKAVAEKLMLSGGREVDLHYKEYMATLPWRGYSKYVVDSIIDIQ
jgi:hypothetical protein